MYVPAMKQRRPAVVSDSLLYMFTWGSSLVRCSVKMWTTSKKRHWLHLILILRYVHVCLLNLAMLQEVMGVAR